MLAGLRYLDHRVFFWINNGWWHPMLHGFFEGLSSLGAWTIGLLALAYLLGRGQRVLRRHAPVLLVFAVLACTVNTTLKRLINRRRPASAFREQIAAGTVTVNVLEKHTPRRFGFPSGHSMLAFFFLTYLGLCDRRCMPCAWSLAALVAVSRVYVGAHFPADCVAGALFGAAWGAAAWRAGRALPWRREVRNDAQQPAE